jgi:hypothetical protein
MNLGEFEEENIEFAWWKNPMIMGFFNFNFNFS